MNIIVALLLLNYKENSDDSYDDDLKEIEEEGKNLSIPSDILGLIIDYDLQVKKETKLTYEQFKKIIKGFLKFQKTDELPKSKYFDYKITRFLFYLIMHPFFSIFIFIVIIANTVILCMDRYELNKSYNQPKWQDTVNYIFIIIFTLEVIIKFFGLGFKKFIQDGYNILDFLIVVLSFIEIIFSSSSGSYTVLRAFRLFRIFKIFKAGELRILIDSLIKTLRSISPFLI